jgi:hypothetical protein
MLKNGTLHRMSEYNFKMSKHKNTSQDAETRGSIIAAVKTPLGFFVLVVLVVEAILGITAGLSGGPDRTYLVLGMIGLIFLLILIVAGCALFRPEALAGRRPALDVDELQELIKLKIREDLLDNFQVPEGFRPEISTDFKFGFCYPKNWRFVRFPQATQYGAAADPEHAKQAKSPIARNVNVIVVDISGNSGDVEELYKTYADQELSVTPNAKRTSAESFLFSGRPAFRQVLRWVDNSGKAIVADQIYVADRPAKNLYVVTFTAAEDDYAASKALFADIASTFRIP